ncbi:MAG: glycosyltransferase, partial [Selenomonas sp.]|nr:glycosyltransferase [Selenomonas sp.]
MSDNCLLSLALIMRDAAGEVLECLKSVAEAVDEMVVVDTGSVDDSVAVVRQFLQEWQKKKNGRMWELGTVKWQDDFALAKNRALLRCHG